MSRICLTDETDTVSKQKGGLAENFFNPFNDIIKT